MRIALDRRQLLGLETARNDIGLPENAAKVGTKNVIVLSTRHDDLNRKLSTPAPKALTFPA